MIKKCKQTLVIPYLYFIFDKIEILYSKYQEFQTRMTCIIRSHTNFCKEEHILRTRIFIAILDLSFMYSNSYITQITNLQVENIILQIGRAKFNSCSYFGEEMGQCNLIGLFTVGEDRISNPLFLDISFETCFESLPILLKVNKVQIELITWTFQLFANLTEDVFNCEHIKLKIYFRYEALFLQVDIVMYVALN